MGGTPTWTLVQPSARKRRWELRRGTGPLCVLQIPSLRRGASIETADRRLWIRQQGRLGRSFGFARADGERLVTAKVRTGLLRSGGEVEVSPAVDGLASIVAAALSCYLLIRRNEQTAASAAASTAGVAS
jgi:hypothetical protein